MGRNSINERPMTTAERKARSRTTKRDEVIACLELALQEITKLPITDQSDDARYWIETAIQRMPK